MTTIVAQRAKQYGTELASTLVNGDYGQINKLRRRLELSMTLPVSEEHMQNIVANFDECISTEKAVVSARKLATAVHRDDYSFLNDMYGATSRKDFVQQVKLLKKLMPAVHSALLGGAAATHLNEYQARGLLRASLLRSGYDYHVSRDLFNKASTDRSKISVSFNNDVCYMMSLQASAMPEALMFPLNYKSVGAQSLSELSEYGGYYCAEGKPLSLEAGQIPYFISYTDSVTLRGDGDVFKYESGCGGFVEFPRDMPIVLYDLKPGVVFTRLTPFLVPVTVWQSHTPERAGDQTYMQYLQKQEHSSDHDRALTKYVAACKDADTSLILAAPFKSLVRVGYDAESQTLLNRILAGCYENNPMYATCDYLFAVTPTMFSRDPLPGMLVRADMIAKASDVNSGQGTLMCINQPASAGAIGLFYSGFDDQLHTHTMDVGIIANALESSFEPCGALASAEMCGSVSVFSHAEHERMIVFFCGHRPDIYSKMGADELWGDMGGYEDYTDWAGDLERLFITLVGVYAKVYDESVGNTVHSLGMVNTAKGDFNVLDAAAMMHEIHESGVHRCFFDPIEFEALGKLVFGEHFHEMHSCMSLRNDPDENMKRKDIKKFKCKWPTLTHPLKLFPQKIHLINKTSNLTHHTTSSTTTHRSNLQQAQQHLPDAHQTYRVQGRWLRIILRAPTYRAEAGAREHAQLPAAAGQGHTGGARPRSVSPSLRRQPGAAR